MPKAISSYQVLLCDVAVVDDKYKFTKLIEIKEYPDMGGTPEMLDCTTTSDPIQTLIPGIQMLDNAGLEFNSNYTKANYLKLQGRADKEQKYGVVFGGEPRDDGTVINNGEGAFIFDGRLSAFPKGGQVNNVVDLGVSIAPSTSIEFIENENTPVLPRDGGSVRPIVARAFKKGTKAIITATDDIEGLGKVVTGTDSSAKVLAMFSGSGSTETVLFELPSGVTEVYIVGKSGTVSRKITLEDDTTGPQVEVVDRTDGITIKVIDDKSGIKSIGDTTYSDYPKAVEGYKVPAGTASVKAVDGLGNETTQSLTE